MADDSERAGQESFAGALQTLRGVARALESAGALFFVGGSLASSLQGIRRSTMDVDLGPSRVDAFVRALGSAVKVDFDLAELLDRAFTEAGDAGRDE